MSFKNSKLAGILAALVLVSVVTIGLMTYDTVSVLVDAASGGKTIHELERGLSDAKAERAKLNKDLQAASANVNSYEAEIIRLDSEIAVLTKQLSIVEKLTDEWKKDKQATEAEIARLEQKRDDEVDIFEAMLRISYQYGTDTYFNLIFGSQDIGDFLSRADLISYHLRANDNILSSLSGTLSDLGTAKKQYDLSIAAIDEYSSQQQTLRTELEGKSAEALKKKQEYEADEKKLKAQISAKDSEMAQMESDIAKYYEEQRKNGNTKVYSGGDFFLPLPRGSYRISSEFKSRISPITGKPENHNGLDLAAPSGTPIYAAASGTVIVSTYSSSWGNVIQIDHGGGLITLYAHCSYRGVTKGQTVTKGQEIGRVGTTGWSTGNHLHFTVYKNGVAQNPRNYLSGV